MTAQPVPVRRFSFAEYLALERKSLERHEFHDGEILAMSGGTADHSLIISNTIITIGSQLRGKPCRLYEGNLRVRIARQRRYVYPDASIICGEPAFDADDPNRTTVTNPRAIVEVLSDSTESYDRGRKFDGYRQIESLMEYMLVSQREPRVESYFRQPDGTWVFTSSVGLETTIHLRSVDLPIPLAEIYAGVRLPDPPPDPPSREEPPKQDR